MSLSNKELLDKIKDEVSREETGKDWDIMKCINGSMTIERLWPIVCERYASEKAKASVQGVNSSLQNLKKDLALVILDDGTIDLINPSKFQNT